MLTDADFGQAEWFRDQVVVAGKHLRSFDPGTGERFLLDAICKVPGPDFGGLFIFSN
jgi:hypothetical protein